MLELGAKCACTYNASLLETAFLGLSSKNDMKTKVRRGNNLSVGAKRQFQIYPGKSRRDFTANSLFSDMQENKPSRRGGR